MNKLSQTDVLMSPCGQAIYIANLKCASSYYLATLKKNSWKKISDLDVDWQNQLIFSTIIDPLERYAKGIVQDLKCFGFDISFWKIMPKNFWEEISWIGVHSMPTTYVFGDKSFLVNWIPLDLPNKSHQVLTDRLLGKIGIHIEWNVKEKINQSSDEEKALKKQIKDLCWGHIKMDFLHNRFPDYGIYNNVIEKYAT